jgi:hypothetical protein
MLKDLFGHSRIEEPIERIRPLSLPRAIMGAFLVARRGVLLKSLQTWPL